MTSFYETLEVSPRASNFVIRAAYRCLAQHDHPDKNPDAQAAGQRMASLNRADAVLSNTEKRRAYDLSQGITPGGGERRGVGAAPAAFAKSQAKPLPTARPFAFRPLV